MENCIFCKIVRGEVPAEIIYEDADTLAFLDIRPKNPGHTLVVPKKHFRNIFDIDDETLCAVMRAVKKIAPAVTRGVGADGVNITSNNEAAAGQDVFHFHVHIIPRHVGDDFKLSPHKIYKPGEALLIGEKIRTAL